MGGMEWAALETVAEMLGVEDVELFVVRLTTIRDWQNENRN
jgi:hypothetical protein